MATRLRWKVAWITGASSGIGKQLALQLAERGVFVAASARSQAKLQSVAEKSPRISAYPVDVTDREALNAVVKQIELDHGPIDLTIFSAGTWRPMTIKNFDAATIAKAMDVNFNGVANSIAAILPQMKERASGHIAIISSLTGYRGLPKSMAYGPGKAALINFAESLKPDANSYGIDVSVINPGFVKTPMTRINDFPMPFLMEVDAAAEKIISGLEKRTFEIAFPWQLVILMDLLRRAPNSLYFILLRWFGVMDK